MECNTNHCLFQYLSNRSLYGIITYVTQEHMFHYVKFVTPIVSEHHMWTYLSNETN